MNNNEAIQDLIQLTQNYVFTDMSKQSENMQSAIYYIYNPAGNTWAEGLSVDAFSSEDKKALEELHKFNKKKDFNKDIKDFKSIKFIIYFWNHIFNNGLYLSVNNNEYVPISVSSNTLIKIYTKDFSEQYISKRNELSKIILTKH